MSAGHGAGALATLGSSMPPCLPSLATQSPALSGCFTATYVNLAGAPAGRLEAATATALVRCGRQALAPPLGKTWVRSRVVAGASRHSLFSPASTRENG